VRRSLGEYARRVWSLWWLLTIGVVFALLGAAALFISGGVVLPAWAGGVILGGCFVGAQFGAFHQIRVERDERPTITAAPSAPLSVGGVAIHVENLHIHYRPPIGGEGSD